MSRPRRIIEMAPGPVVDLEPFDPPPRNRPNRQAKERIKKRDCYRCRYCGSEDDLTVDHVIPKSKGGTNRTSNLVTACQECNLQKANQEGIKPMPPPLTGRKARQRAS